MKPIAELDALRLPIYLIGYMGAGKTTVGRLLADRLGWHFVDLDDAFAEIHGATPADYIRSHGTPPQTVRNASDSSAEI